MADDVAAGLHELAGTPATVVGHSLGGVVAFLLASRHPDLVAGLVVVDASPSPNAEAQRRAAAWFRTWPVPFEDRDAAGRFLPEGWLANLEWRDGGWWPAFEVEAMLELEPRDRWAEWRQVACPAVLILAEHSFVSAEDAEAMATRTIRVPGSRHDIHLSTPDAWRRALEAALEL